VVLPAGLIPAPNARMTSDLGTADEQTKRLRANMRKAIGDPKVTTLEELEAKYHVPVLTGEEYKLFEIDSFIRTSASWYAAALTYRRTGD
jgi:hypothetical protein